MKKSKQKLSLFVLTLLLILVVAGCNMSKQDEIESSKIIDKETIGLSVSESEHKELSNLAEPSGILVIVNNNDWIFLDGESINDGKSKQMECDLDGDGSSELFSIGMGTPNGVEVLCGTDQISINYAYENELYDAFDEYGELFEDYGFQITCYDLDDDGIKELIVSIGDQSYEMQSSVYRFTKSIDDPFELISYLDGQERMYIRDNGMIEAPFGSQGLLVEYKYFNSIMYEVDLSGKLVEMDRIVFDEYEEDFNDYIDDENYDMGEIHIGDIVSKPGYLTKMLGEVTDIANGKYKVYWYNCVDLVGAKVTDESVLRMSHLMSGVTLDSSEWCEGDTLTIESSAYQ